MDEFSTQWREDKRDTHILAKIDHNHKLTMERLDNVNRRLDQQEHHRRDDMRWMYWLFTLNAVAAVSLVVSVLMH